MEKLAGDLLFLFDKLGELRSRSLHLEVLIIEFQGGGQHGFCYIQTMGLYSAE